MNREEAERAAITWMVFKPVIPISEQCHHDRHDLSHSYSEECQRIWGLLVNPENPTECITLTTNPRNGYVLMNGEQFELDTYMWGLVDMCIDDE